MTQQEWQAEVSEFLDACGCRPELIAEVVRRMERGAVEGHNGHPVEPDALNFLQDRIEEAMDGTVYVVGDMVERGVNPLHDKEALTWATLLQYLSCKQAARRTLILRDST